MLYYSFIAVLYNYCFKNREQPFYFQSWSLRQRIILQQNHSYFPVPPERQLYRDIHVASVFLNRSSKRRTPSFSPFQLLASYCLGWQSSVSADYPLLSQDVIYILHLWRNNIFFFSVLHTPSFHVPLKSLRVTQRVHVTQAEDQWARGSAVTYPRLADSSNFCLRNKKTKIKRNVFNKVQQWK